MAFKQRNDAQTRVVEIYKDASVIVTSQSNRDSYILQRINPKLFIFEQLVKLRIVNSI